MSDPTRMPSTPDTLDLCCGGKKCPVFRDGGAIISIADVEAGATPVVLDKADLPRIIAWLTSKLP